MLLIGQERSKENAALAVEPGCASDCSGTTPWSSSSLQQFQAHTTSAKRWPVLLKHQILILNRSRKRIPDRVWFAKTPHEAVLIHVICYTTSLYFIDLKRALNFGDAHLTGNRYTTWRAVRPRGESISR